MVQLVKLVLLVVSGLRVVVTAIIVEMVVVLEEQFQVLIILFLEQLIHQQLKVYTTHNK